MRRRPRPRSTGCAWSAWARRWRRGGDSICRWRRSQEGREGGSTSTGAPPTMTLGYVQAVEKEQAADVCLRQSVNQLYNNKKYWQTFLSTAWVRAILCLRMARDIKLFTLQVTLLYNLFLVYWVGLKGLNVILSRTQAGPGRAVKQEQ